ncbi:hypothetical protein F2P45_06530 [Massilia sp. CCM 8733]|uniref:Uncharacterized protein n=1 Tax=Massilia mucilaginosa TaxID=2609282 RepID=A0ABX0NPG1_9BURK|nr:hypothetical protein [Massilia mucilaginosa]NHZ88681.1 hypothetical protein [Massilia mucilaginosa]
MLAAFTNIRATIPATTLKVNTMKTPGKQQADELATYKRASAALRKKIAAAAVPDEREILPVNGRIHLSLAGTPLNAEQQKALFGASAFSPAVMRELADDGS